MASTPTTAYSQWTTFEDTKITAENIPGILGSLPDDLWVASACIDRVLDDTAAQHTLLTLGISRTHEAVERCNTTIALASSSQEQSLKFRHDALLAHFQNVPGDAQLLNLRAILLQRLDLLNTYVELEQYLHAKEGAGTDEDIAEWEDDPWADDLSTKRTPQSMLTTSAPSVSLSEFLQNNLQWSAWEFASLQILDALGVLIRRYTSFLWPYRFKLLECIPEHTHPSMCRPFFPTLDNSTNLEAIPTNESWRTTPDFCELQEVQAAVAESSSMQLKGVGCGPFDELIPIHNPLSPDELSTWYKNRVDRIISSTGMVDVALSLVQHATSQGIPSLDELGEELGLLSRLVYDTPYAPESDDDWTLNHWYSMDPPAVVAAYLARSTQNSVCTDISTLVLPYLFVLETRAERAGTPDSSLPSRILYDSILTTDLEKVAAIFEHSKPTISTAQRIIKDDEDMARLALACLYGSNSLTEWSTMSTIFECLPAWDVMDADSDEADTTVAALGAFLTPSTNQPSCNARDLLVFLKPLPIASLSRALDILDVHLESGEILARWGVPAPLRWFLQSSGEISEQRSWATRMARRAGGQEDKLNGQEDWEWLLEDMLKLVGNGETGFRGAFCLLTRTEVTSIFLSGLLSTGRFDIAKHMLQGPHSVIHLDSKAIQDVCLTCSREFYDNALSGNYKMGDMKLAFECLEVPQSSPDISREKEFIEATSRISSFNVCSSPGHPISPIEIRLTQDRLSLISRVLSSNNDAYKHTEVILDLCYKLGYKDNVVAKVKVLAMLADTALQVEDFSRAYQSSERMVQVIYAVRSSPPLDIDETRLAEAVDVCWITCFQLGRHPSFQDLPKKMTLLGNALDLCPPEKLHDVLTAWRRLETEDQSVRLEKLQQRRNGAILASNTREVNLSTRNVASSLRARLQDFHMPSPPMLNTPDAAALASRTFKTVAANFPFSVGHRGHAHKADRNDRGTTGSETSQRSDSEDVSSQASRVFSKGIGWLIGADEP